MHIVRPFGPAFHGDDSNSHPARASIGAIRGLATNRALSRLQVRFGLSNRELAVLHAIVLGESTQLTAGQLRISDSTLKSYRKRAYAKLVVENEVEAAICITAVLFDKH